jgi:hypothetical protein
MGLDAAMVDSCSYERLFELNDVAAIRAGEPALAADGNG